MNGDEIIHLYNQKVNSIGKYSLMHWMRHYIYGMTPTNIALGECFSIFAINQKSRYKILFLVTDGKNNQGSDPYSCVRQYLEVDGLKNVIIICCYFSSEKIENPRKLYYQKPKKINSFCEMLFNMSSVLPIDAPSFKILSEKYNCYERSVRETANAIERNDPNSSRYSALYFICPNCSFLVRNDDISTASPTIKCDQCNHFFVPQNAKLLRGIYK